MRLLVFQGTLRRRVEHGIGWLRARERHTRPARSEGAAHPKIRIRSVHSNRAVRSAKAFAVGGRGGQHIVEDPDEVRVPVANADEVSATENVRSTREDSEVTPRGYCPWTGWGFRRCMRTPPGSPH